jgi:hypothetical protein
VLAVTVVGAATEVAATVEVDAVVVVGRAWVRRRAGRTTVVLVDAGVAVDAVGRVVVAAAERWLA